jgi:hypothetical protein
MFWFIHNMLFKFFLNNLNLSFINYIFFFEHIID